MDSKVLDKSDDNIIRITKKYIIDMLDAILFSNELTWGGIDQFNELPILNMEEDRKAQIEQRSALFLHRRSPMALRVLVTAMEAVSKRVCYRITSIREKLEVVELRRIFLPTEQMYLDFSIADTNLGLVQDSSYSFSINFDFKSDKEKSIIFNLLRFLLDSEFYAYDDSALFKDLLDDVLSMPPIPGDQHYKLVFGINRD
jgi:hypothetical protein